MRKGFTLIELMIVIAIIAIIAAIAIPNLLESRVTSQESAAAAALKTGILPAEVQFQAGGYWDFDGDGIGIFGVVTDAVANPYAAMCGGVTVGPAASPISLTLLAPSYGVPDPVTISGYIFKQPITADEPDSGTPSDGTGENTFGVICYPADEGQGRRYYAINQAGNVYSSKPAASATADGAADDVTTVFGASLTSAPDSSIYVPYRK